MVSQSSNSTACSTLADIQKIKYFPVPSLFPVSYVDPSLICVLQSPADLCIPSQLAHPTVTRKALKGAGARCLPLLSESNELHVENS